MYKNFGYLHEFYVIRLSVQNSCIILVSLQENEHLVLSFYHLLDKRNINIFMSHRDYSTNSSEKSSMLFKKLVLLTGNAIT